MESATTNLSELTCDFVRLWDKEALQHKDVKELFVAQASVVAPEAVEVQVGDEVDTELVYPAPSDEQVPSLKGLLAYIDAKDTGGAVSKYYTTHRRHFTLQEGPVQQVKREVTVNEHRHEQLVLNETHTTLKKQSHLHTNHRYQVNTSEHHSYVKRVRRTNRVALEVFAPVVVVKKITNVRITRPIYIFTS
jgi:hypothetical protein